MQKLKYEIDPHNRLVVSLAGKKSDLTRFRRVFDGKFKLGPENSLIYHIKAPMEGVEPEITAPHQVKLKGKWSLNKNHDLVLTLDKWRRQIPGDQLTLQGQIVSAKANSLSVLVTTRSEKNIDLANILRFEGSWQADRHNRLSLKVKKGKGRHDSLIFDGIWEVDRKNRVVYRYEKTQMLLKRKVKQSIIFEGYWGIARRNRLSYKISRQAESVFEFQTEIAVLDKNYIKYRIGIGVSGKQQPIRQVVTLFGTWRIKKNLGLLFEIDYAKGKTKAIVFGADAKLSKRDKLEFKLRNELGKDLGLRLKLSRRLLKGDGQAFFKLLKSKKEVKVYVGAAWRW